MIGQRMVAACNIHEAATPIVCKCPDIPGAGGTGRCLHEVPARDRFHNPQVGDRAAYLTTDAVQALVDHCTGKPDDTAPHIIPVTLDTVAPEGTPEHFKVGPGERVISAFRHDGKVRAPIAGGKGHQTKGVCDLDRDNLECMTRDEIIRAYLVIQSVGHMRAIELAREQERRAFAEYSYWSMKLDIAKKAVMRAEAINRGDEDA